MIEITKAERDKILAQYPLAEIHSTKTKFFLTTSDTAMSALSRIRGVKAPKQRNPQYYANLDKGRRRA